MTHRFVASAAVDRRVYSPRSRDARMSATSEKVLLAFNADQPDVNLLVLLSPALRETEPTRYDQRFQLRTVTEQGPDVDACPPGACEYVLHEPDCPWWRPELRGAGRRWVYRTTDFDQVEVIVDDGRGAVALRALSVP